MPARETGEQWLRRFYCAPKYPISLTNLEISIALRKDREDPIEFLLSAKQNRLYYGFSLVTRKRL